MSLFAKQLVKAAVVATGAAHGLERYEIPTGVMGQLTIDAQQDLAKLVKIRAQLEKKMGVDSMNQQPTTFLQKSKIVEHSGSLLKKKLGAKKRDGGQIDQNGTISDTTGPENFLQRKVFEIVEPLSSLCSVFRETNWSGGSCCGWDRKPENNAGFHATHQATQTGGGCGWGKGVNTSYPTVAASPGYRHGNQKVDPKRAAELEGFRESAKQRAQEDLDKVEAEKEALAENFDNLRSENDPVKRERKRINAEMAKWASLAKPAKDALGQEDEELKRLERMRHDDANNRPYAKHHLARREDDATGRKQATRVPAPPRMQQTVHSPGSGRTTHMAGRRPDISDLMPWMPQCCLRRK